MRETRHPVILATHIQPAIGDGAWIEVECVEAAEVSGNTHRGGWKIYVCALDPDGGVQRAVHVTGRNLEARIFKTVKGLTSFALELGLHVISFPVLAGKWGIWRFGTSKIPEDHTV